MDELMLKFLKQYNDNILYAFIIHEDSTSDYYEVRYAIRILSFDVVSLHKVEYDKKCKVSVEVFHRYKEIQEAIIWE